MFLTEFFIFFLYDLLWFAFLRATWLVLLQFLLQQKFWYNPVISQASCRTKHSIKRLDKKPNVLHDYVVARPAYPSSALPNKSLPVTCFLSWSQFGAAS